MSLLSKQEESASDASDSEGSDSSVFRNALGKKSSSKDVHSIARQHPGRLTKQWVAGLSQNLQASQGIFAEGASLKSSNLVKGHLYSQFLPSNPDISLRNKREAVTLATALDFLVSGQTEKGMDVLVQRFKALEKAVVDKSWDVSRWMELIPSDKGGSLSLQEEKQAMQQEALYRKISESGKKKETDKSTAANQRSQGSYQKNQGSRQWNQGQRQWNQQGSWQQKDQWNQSQQDQKK